MVTVRNAEYSSLTHFEMGSLWPTAFNLKLLSREAKNNCRPPPLIPGYFRLWNEACCGTGRLKTKGQEKSDENQNKCEGRRCYCRTWPGDEPQPVVVWQSAGGSSHERNETNKPMKLQINREARCSGLHHHSDQRRILQILESSGAQNRREQLTGTCISAIAAYPPNGLPVRTSATENEA